ncbi:DUF6328 family protein, partial [Staphylococcus aureus]
MGVASDPPDATGCGDADPHRRPPRRPPGRAPESAAQRADRNWADVLQELRVLQTGTQILTGFL